MKLFVWDFHGVLETGNQRAVLEISNEILKRFGYSERFTQGEIDNLYGRKWFEYFEYLLPQEPYKRHLELQEACRYFGLSNSKVIARHIRQNDYATEILEAIARKHKQILISNTSQDSLRMFLMAVKLNNFFSDENVFAVDAHMKGSPRTKDDVLKDFLKGRKFDEIVIIGDTPDDMALASVAGGTTYLYAHPGKPFPECGADYRINDLREILREV